LKVLGPEHADGRLYGGGKGMKMKARDEDQEPAIAVSNPSLSRRKFLKVSVASAAIVGTGGISGCMYSPTMMRAAGTTPKSVARYRNSPNRGRRCAGCTHFLKPNRCEIVAGEISPNGWCRFHTPVPV
jgi:hypothetical protein